MAMCFDTKNLSFALSVLLHFIFGYDLTSMEKCGLNFTTDAWQSIRVIKNSCCAQFEKLTYSVQLKVCKSAYSDLGIRTTHCMHISRTAGLQMAEQLDVPDAQLRLMCGWDHSKMVQHYSSKIARQGARMMAGQESECGRFYLSHDCLDPPENLHCMVFPCWDESIELVEG